MNLDNPGHVRAGTRVRFAHGDATLTGVVNGAPFVIFTAWHDARAYVPVHVHDRNRNLLVDIRNLVELA